MSGSAQTVISVVVIAVVALIGLAVIGPIFGVMTDAGITSTDTAVEPAPTEFTTLEAGFEPSDLEVTPSTGTAIGLFADGYVDLPPPDAATRADGWALAATVEPLTVDPDNSYVIYAEGNATVLVEYEAGNYSARYDDGSLTGYVTAPASGDRQAVSVSYDESAGELRLYIDGQLRDSAPLTSTIEPRQPAYEWDGTIDEFRRWDRPVDDATHAAYASDPVQPLAPGNATHRAMFNEGDVDEVYYANGSARRVGETELVDGVQPPTLDRGVDYELETTTTPTQFRATDTGYLAGAPVVLIDGGGPLGGAALGIVGGLSSAIQLLPVLMLVLLASIVIATVARLQNA